MIPGACDHRSRTREGYRFPRCVRRRWWVLGFLVAGALGTGGCEKPATGSNRSGRIESIIPPELDRLISLAGGSTVRFSRNEPSTATSPETTGLGFGPFVSAVERARLATEIEWGLSTVADPDRLHPLGLLQAVQGDLDPAITALRGAALEEPSRSDLWTDLGAAHLLRHEEQGRARDLIAALRYSDRALALDAGNASAAFNRAEALTRLFLIEQGPRSWDHFLRLEPSGAWAEMGRRRRATLLVEDTEQRCDGARRAVLAAWERQGAFPTAAGRDLPHCLRMWVLEDLLPAWAQAWRGGDPEAGDLLSLAGSLGDHIAAVTGDFLLVDVIRPIEKRIRSGNWKVVEQQAVAIENLDVGLDAYRRQDFAAVLEAMEAVVDGLEEENSPLRCLASYYLAVLDYYAGVGGAGAAFEQILSDHRVERYLQLRGFCVLMLGTIESSTGDSERGVELYHSALPLLERSAGDVVGHLLYPSLGDGLRLLGLEEEAWSAYVSGLEASALYGDRRRYATALYTVVELLLERSELDAAQVFAEELVSNARNSDLPSVVSQAYLQRGRVRHALGLLDEAAIDLNLARTWADQIEGEGHRERIGGAVDLANAALQIETSPMAALEQLDRVLEDRTSKGYLYRLPRIHLLSSRAHGALGDRRRQQEELGAGLRLSEQLRAEAADPRHRRSLFAQAREIFEEAVQFWVESGDSDVAAFEIAERGRARELAESIGPSGIRRRNGGFRPYGLAEIQALLPTGTVIVEYFALPDRLVTWTVSSGGFRQRVRAIDRADLMNRIARFHHAIERQAPSDDVRAQAGELHQLLLRDALAGVEPDATLVFVPDRFLAEVPFAALAAAGSGRFLIQEFSVAESPSATVYAATIERAASAPSRSQSILSVGDPAFSPRMQPGLERLPASDKEAQQVWESFSRGDLLTGAQATETAVVAALSRHSVAYFATHATVDSVAPERSALVLAGSTESDGLLTADEIRTLDLRGISLVVLAVCDPIQGSEHGEEALTGLVAAFLSAGVEAVVAPTRPVSESSTTWLLDFQREVAKGGEGFAAFRHAQSTASTSGPVRDWSSFRWIGLADSTRKEP